MRLLAVHPGPLMYTKIFLRLEPLGLELVAQAARQAGHEVRLLDLQLESQDRYLRTIDDWQPQVVAFSCKMGIPFTHVDTSDSVEGWKARDIPSLGDIRSLGLITLGRFRSSTRGLAAKRRAVSISGGFAGRMALSAPTARPWASRGECRAACCAVEPAIGRYR